MFAAAKRPENQPYVPHFSAYDVRKALYRTTLAGAAGFTYGCEPMRQLVRDGDRVHVWPDAGLPVWQEAISAPGSAQVGLIREILEPRRFVTRRPAQELLVPIKESGAWPDRMSIGMEHAATDNRDPAARVSVAACSEGEWIIAYVPVRQMFDLDTSGLTGDRMRVSLYDPESRELTREFETPNTQRFRFVPERDLDTVLVIDAM